MHTLYIHDREPTFCLLWNMFLPFFSSPEPKAQVSFSDQNLSVVRRRRRCRRRCCRKLFTFSSSSYEPLRQFHTILTQSILGWRGFKFVQIIRTRPYPKEDNYEIVKINRLKDFSRTTGLISTKLDINHPWLKKKEWE